MENKSFRRFNPEVDNHETYLQQDSHEHKHARAVSVLTGIFNPLVAEFVESIADVNPADILEKTGTEPEIELGDLSPHYYSNPTPTFYGKPLRHVDRYFSSPSLYNRHESPLYAPVGEYGPEMAGFLIQAGRSMQTLLLKHPTNHYQQTDQKYEKFLSQETFQKKTFPIMMEAIQSIVAGLSLLTVDKVPGYDNDPMKLCQDIVNSNLLERIANLIPPAYIFPMARKGTVFNNPLENVHGKLILSAILEKDLLRAHHEAQLAAMEGSRGRGCPAAARTITDGDHKTSGITLLSRSLLPFLSYEYQKTLEEENKV